VGPRAGLNVTEKGKMLGILLLVGPFLLLHGQVTYSKKLGLSVISMSSLSEPLRVLGW
jgi:hypothetical protein